VIISHSQAQQLLEAQNKRLEYLEISLDLGLSKTKVSIESNFFIFPENQKINGFELKKAIKNDASCFLIKGNALIKFQLFSEQTKKYYKLVPTKDAPTLEISGVRMHVTKGMTPIEDTKRKIESVSPIKGMVLDTCMGLGYTAILASKNADFVITCEKDENVVEIASLNPWSKELFNNKKISILKGSIFEEAKILKSSMFDAVIHDPPRLSLATELYSLQFYQQLFRVLKKRGMIYHYTGSPGSKNRKINITGNVGKRLGTAGFREIKKAHYGLTARKP